MPKVKASFRLKIILIISVVIVASCEKSSDTKNVNKSIKISSEYSINSSCSDYNLEKLKFNKDLTAKEYYELNNKLKHLYSLNDDDIYKKYDLSKDIILYLNKIKEKNATISENSYFLELKKSSIIDFEASKNSIESESDFHSSIFQSLYNKIIDNDNEYFLLDSLNDKNKTIEIRSLKHENKYTKVIHESDFKSLTDFKNLIEIHSNNMINKIENIEHLNISHPSIGLSHAYLLKNIMDYFNDNSNPNDKEKSNSTLYKVIKAQVYANLVQLSSDVIDSGLKTAHIIEILRTNELDNLNFFRTFSKYSSKINIGLNFLNVLFDAYELNHAETNSELTRYKTQLGFDSASSGLILGGMILGDSIAGTFLSGIGEIFGGLAIGFSSYAEVVGENIDIAINNANYFRYYEEDHYRILNSNNFVPFSENKELSLAHKYVKKDNIDNYKEQLDVVINEIDLTKQDFYKIKFGDHLTYPISRHDSDSIYYHPFAPPPELITSSTEYVKFREALEIPEEKEFKLNNINKIILPNQTQKFIKYRHGFYAPWITYRNDAELNAVRKIQRNSKFIFEYSVMRGAGDMAISELKFESKNTDIKIKLNSKNSGIHFISPQIHDSSENKINYYFEVDKSEKLSSNKFNLHLNNSSKYYINSHSNDIWHFHIEDRFLDSNFDKSYKNLNIKHSGNKDKDFTILFSDNKPSKIYIHDKLGVTYLIFNKEHIKAIPVNINLNYENFKDKNELEFAIDELREKFKDKVKYIKILNYLNSSNNIKETIFYDLSNYEYIYSNLSSSDLIIIDKINSIPIFFDKSNKSLHYSSVVAKNVTDIRYNSNKYFITSTENNENLVYEINDKDIKIVETTNLKFKKELLGKLVRIIDCNDNSNLQYFLSITNEYFGNQDKFAKIIHSYKDDDENEYFFISGKKFYAVKISNNNIVTRKEYDFSDLKKESGLHNNLLFSSAKFIYRIDENLNMSITALRPDFIRENINLTLSEMLKKLVFDQNIIHIIFNDEDHAEYNLKQNKIYYYSKNKIPFGESVDDSSKFYFYDKVDRKFYSVSNEYLNPDLFKVIRNENGLLKLEFKNSLIWKFENSGNLKIQSLNNSKKIAFILNNIHNVRKKIHTEECNKIENIKDLKLLNLKNSLCILGSNSNISDKKLVTAFSKQNNQTLIFDDAQSSFRQLDSVTGKIFLQGTVNEYWGVADWLGNSSPFTDYPKLLAFGELPNQFTRSNSKNSIYMNDIRFIDSEGYILRATSGIKNLNTKNYYVEKELNKDYVNSIFGAFVFNKDKHTLYFLKNNLKFDELDTNYDIIATGNISDLFHMLPIDDIPKINTIIKLDNYISLFKSDGKKLVGFYLIPIEDLFTDKELNNRFYIKL